MRRWKTPFLLSPGALSTTPDYTQTNALVFQRKDERTKRKTDHSFRCVTCKTCFLRFFNSTTRPFLDLCTKPGETLS